VKTLIMAQFRIETATPEGTFASATKVLDHYAEMGVNGLWINPIWERGSKDNGYANYGPNTIEPILTGTKSIQGSRETVRRFVDEAHKRNIRVFFDIIVWGTSENAPLVTQHPEFYLKRHGELVPAWGGWAFNWESAGLQDWYQQAAVEFIEKTGADGFRVDLAPNTSGYYFKQVRDPLYAKGHKIALFSELPNERKDTFDFEQMGAHGWNEEPTWGDRAKYKDQERRFGHHYEFPFRNNIVDAIRTGTGIGKAKLQRQQQGGRFRFYTANLLCHDDKAPFVCGNRVRFAYGSIFAPFIPLWWIGEEWDNPKDLRSPGNTGVMFLNTIDWSKRDSGVGRVFFEDVKKYIRIRRRYPEIFECFPENHRDANIVKVETSKRGIPNNLQAYARYGSDKAVVVVPNYAAGDGADSNCCAEFEIAFDCAALGLRGASPRGTYKVTDLMTGEVLFQKAQQSMRLHVSILAEHLGIYLVEYA
jgi:hypothetical protein